MLRNTQLARHVSMSLYRLRSTCTQLAPSNTEGRYPICATRPHSVAPTPPSGRSDRATSSTRSVHALTYSLSIRLAAALCPFAVKTWPACTHKQSVKVHPTSNGRVPVTYCRSVLHKFDLLSFSINGVVKFTTAFSYAVARYSSCSGAKAPRTCASRAACNHKHRQRWTRNHKQWADCL